MHSNYINTPFIGMLSSLAIILAGCGGGGGGGGSDPGPTSQAIADSAIVNEDSNVSISVLANDLGVNGDTLAISTQPTNGDATLSNNNIVYTPNANFNGTDRLTYSVAGSNNTNLTGVVTITISSINDLPTVTNDSFLIQSNTSSLLTVLVNDSDIDGELTSIELVTQPANGAVSIINDAISYVPNNNFSGTDSFVYRAIDDENGISTSEATVSITIDGDLTLLTITSIDIPTAGYTQQNNAEFGTTVLTSPAQSFTVPNNAVSFNLSLQGSGVDDAIGNSLFIASITDPNGNPVSPFDPNALFCDTGLCTALIPRNPQIAVTPGEWRFTLGTLQPTLEDLSFTNIDLELALRSGPSPDSTSTLPTSLKIQPYLTATTIDTTELGLVLSALKSLAASNNLELAIEPTILISDPRFNEVSSSFNNNETAALVSMGAADSINIFFLESFAGVGGSGLVGISSGLPGTMGIAGKYNGVLLNATATFSTDLTRYRQSTAEFSLHEIGHFIGLYHTTEQGFEANDVILDTPICEKAVHDVTPFDSIADTDECPDGLNIMFWSNDLDQVKDPLSPDQRSVYQTAPIGQSGS